MRGNVARIVHAALNTSLHEHGSIRAPRVIQYEALGLRSAEKTMRCRTASAPRPATAVNCPGSITTVPQPQWTELATQPPNSIASQADAANVAQHVLDTAGILYTQKLAIMDESKRFNHLASLRISCFSAGDPAVLPPPGALPKSLALPHLSMNIETSLRRRK